MANWIVKYSYREKDEAINRESNVLVVAENWSVAKKKAAELLKGKYPSIQILSAYQTTTHVNQYEKDARVINAINEKLLKYNIGILILSIILFVLSGILILGGIVGLIYRGMVQPPTEPELLNIYNNVLTVTVVFLIAGPLLGIGTFILFKFKGKKK